MINPTDINLSSLPSIPVADLRPGDTIYSLSGFPLGKFLCAKSTIFYCRDLAGAEQGYAYRWDTRVKRMEDLSNA